MVEVAFTFKEEEEDEEWTELRGMDLGGTIGPNPGGVGCDLWSV